MCFTAYFDESGTQAESSAVIFAGYLSTAGKWEAFDLEWKAVLKKHDIDFFHMTDFAGGWQQFAGWSEDKRRYCLGALHDVICRNVIGSIGFGISRAAFDAIMSREASNFMGGPYGLLANTVMMELSALLRVSGVRGQIAYRFEAGAKGIGQVSTIFNRNLASPRHSQFHRLLSFDTGNKRKYTPLQAADILAYELYKQLPKQLGFDSLPPRPFPLPSLGRVPHLWGHVGKENLATFNKIATIAAGLRERDLEFGAPAEPEPERGILPITIAEFQQRWNWYSQLMVRGELPTEQTS